MAELVAAGKVRYLGLSEAAPDDDPPRARRASDLGAADRVFDLEPRSGGEILPTIRELGIGFVPYSPLGSRLPDGRGPFGRSARRGRFPPLQPALPGRQPRGEHPHRGGRRPRCQGGRRHTGAGRAGLAATRRGTDMVPIPGTKRRTYLEENVGALNVSLSCAAAGRTRRGGGCGRRPLPGHVTGERLGRAHGGVGTAAGQTPV